MKCCINGRNVIRLLLLSAKLLKFEIQKCGQILCAHKPYFLMPGHIYECAFTDRGEIKTNKGIQKNICRKCYYLLEKLLKCEEVCTHKILAKI